jgi:hypothetical protein
VESAVAGDLRRYLERLGQHGYDIALINGEYVISWAAMVITSVPADPSDVTVLPRLKAAIRRHGG